MTREELQQAEDSELVRVFLEGERAAFEVLVLRHQDRVYRLCLRTVHDPKRAEEAAQESNSRSTTKATPSDSTAAPSKMYSTYSTPTS